MPEDAQPLSSKAGLEGRVLYTKWRRRGAQCSAQGKGPAVCEEAGAARADIGTMGKAGWMISWRTLQKISRPGVIGGGHTDSIFCVGMTGGSLLSSYLAFSMFPKLCVMCVCVNFFNWDEGGGVEEGKMFTETKQAERPGFFSINNRSHWGVLGEQLW